MAEGGKCSTSSRIVALRQLLHAGSRLCAILQDEMEGETRPHVVREGELIEMDGQLDRFVATKEDEEQFGHTFVKYGEWKLAMKALWDTFRTARPICGEMKAVDDLLLLYVQVKDKNEKAWSLDKDFPNTQSAGAAVGISVPHQIVQSQRALEHIEAEIQRLEAEQTMARKRPLPPLSKKEKAVFDLIKHQPEGSALKGGEIISKLDQQGIFLEQSTLTRHIIPKLRERGITNRHGVGYYYDPQDPD